MDELTQHPRLIIEVLAAYWVFSAFVTSMPKPKADSYWGSWVYDFLHLFAGSVKQFADQRIQSLTQTTIVKTEQVKPAAADAPVEKKEIDK